MSFTVQRQKDPCTGHELIRMTHNGGQLEATVAPAFGGEVSSLRWNGQELLYRANQFDAPPSGGWRGRAPLLWPAVGRNFGPRRYQEVVAQGADPSEGSFLYKGKEWPIPIHGFAARQIWQVVDTGVTFDSAFVRLRLDSHPRTRQMYPFDFRLEVEHRLTAGRLRSAYRLSALTDGLFASFGNHITLALPGGPEAFDATSLRLSADDPHLLELVPPGLTTGRIAAARPDLADGSARLSDTALLDAVTAGFTSAPAHLELHHPLLPPLSIAQWGSRLVLPAASPGVEEVKLPLNPQHFHFVLWGNRELQFFCPEPWYGLPDSLNTREGVVILGAGETAEWVMEIRINAE
ncbi:MAG: hypothetical protein IMX00_08015 [Limnochordales bacterium]|nr:hypothetical protein [Limnochordales bacterium]